MALACLVYPGAVHTRLHHALGAYHLMCSALNELKGKGVDITTEEEEAAQVAILLHDIGHGPFSHALEGHVLKGMHHEQMSLLIMQNLNEQMGGRLSMAIDVFTNSYPKKFLHQLVSGQIDVDRMDYLTRDCFFTGVSEGVIGYHRILKMLAVHDGELMVEEKGIYSIEKFLVARRQMYWQVYLHKTVLSAEMMLVRILKRARHLVDNGNDSLGVGGALDFFLYEYAGNTDHQTLPLTVINQFICLDDSDIMFAIKNWSRNADVVLSELCKRLLNRQLLKIKLQSQAFDAALYHHKIQEAMELLQLDELEAAYFVFTGEADNTMYNMGDDKINILYKDGTVRDITSIDNPLIHQTISARVKKFFICSLS